MDTPASAPQGMDVLFGTEPAPAPSPVPAIPPAPAGQPPAPALPPGGPAPNVDPAQLTQQVPPAAPPVPVPTPAPTPAPEPQQRTVPLPELLEQRHRYQAERAAREAVERQNAQLMEVLQRMQRPQQQQPPIDPVAEPERAFHALTAAVDQRLQAIEQARQADLATVNQQMLNQQLNMSERQARGQHGNEVVDAALQAALTQGMHATFVNQPDPYAALVQWHRANELAREVGTDPAAYRARIAQQERERVLAELRTGRQPSSVPPSIAAATNGATAPQGVISDGEFFSQMFGRRTPKQG